MKKESYQSMMDFIKKHKSENMSCLQYYCINKQKCHDIANFEQEKTPKHIIALLATEDFCKPEDFTNSYFSQGKISDKDKNQVLQNIKCLGYAKSEEPNSNRIIFHYYDISIRAILYIHLRLIIDCDNEMVQFQPEINSLVINNLNPDYKLPFYTKSRNLCIEKWQTEIQNMLFPKMNKNIGLKDLSKDKIEKIYISLFDLLSKDYITTDIHKLEHGDFIPCKISSPKEILENEKEIQLKKKNNISLSEHPDISFPFEERCIWWLKNYCNNIPDKKLCLILKENYGGFFNKISLEIEFGFNSTNVLRLDMELTRYIHDYTFTVEANEENTIINFYEGDKKKYSCLFLESAGFPEKCFKYVEQKIEKRLNHPVIKLLVKHDLKCSIIETLKGNLDNKKDIKLMYSGKFTVDNLCKRLLPIKLKKEKIFFDLSKIENAHIASKYAEEFLSLIDRNMLTSLIKDNDIPKLANKKQRL